MGRAQAQPATYASHPPCTHAIFHHVPARGTRLALELASTRASTPLHAALCVEATGNIC